MAEPNNNLTSEANLGPLQNTKTSKRLSNKVIFLIIGLVCAVVVAMVVGTASKSKKTLTPEEQQAQQIQADKDTAENKDGFKGKGLERNSRTDITGTVIEGIPEISEEVVTDSKDKPQESAVIKDKSDANNDLQAKLDDLYKENISLKQDLMDLKTQFMKNDPNSPLSKENEEDMKQLKAMKKEIAALKQRQFVEALTKSSRTNFQVNSSTTASNGVRMSNIDSNDPSGSLSALQQKQSELQSRMQQADAQLASLRSGNTGTQVVGRGPGYVDGLTAPSVAGREVNNTGRAATMSSPDAYAVFEHNGSWELNNSLTNPVNDFMVRAGMVIPATLISGMTSDTSGQVIAQVSQNVFDTATGKYLLIPQGTRLVGTYQAGAIFGQERILVAWQRLIYPDNKVLDLGAMPGADISGYSGFTDQVNNHWWKLISSAFLMSGVTATISVATADKNNNNNNNTSMSQEGRIALANQFGSVVAQVIQRNLNVAPTLTIRPGYRFNVMITKDMTFGKPYKAFDYKI